MLIFLYGPDTYRSKQKLNEIIKGYKKVHPSGLNFKYYDATENSFKELWDELWYEPMFKEKKLIILKNIFQKAEFKEKILKYSKNLNVTDNIIVFFENGEVSEKDPLFKFLIKNSKSQKFEFLFGQNLKSWIKKEFEKYKIRVNPEVAEKLANFTGNESWQLSNEIKKLAAYRKEKNIQLKDIELLVKPRIETDIFKMINAIATKNKKQAILLLHKHLQKGDPPSYLLNMINFQFRNLILVKSMTKNNHSYQSILKKSKLHPFVVKKSFWQAQRFSLLELKKIYQKIFKADLAIKTGKVNPETALDLLIAEI